MHAHMLAAANIQWAANPPKVFAKVLGPARQTGCNCGESVAQPRVRSTELDCLLSRPRVSADVCDKKKVASCYAYPVHHVMHESVK